MQKLNKAVLEEYFGDFIKADTPVPSHASLANELRTKGSSKQRERKYSCSPSKDAECSAKRKPAISGSKRRASNNATEKPSNVQKVDDSVYIRVKSIFY